MLSVFHQFWEAKFAYGFDLRLEPILATAPSASKNSAYY